MKSHCKLRVGPFLSFILFLVFSQRRSSPILFFCFFCPIAFPPPPFPHCTCICLASFALMFLFFLFDFSKLLVVYFLPLACSSGTSSFRDSIFLSSLKFIKTIANCDEDATSAPP